MKNTITPSLVKKAINHLKTSDKILSNVIKKHGQCNLQPATYNLFHTLTSSIISQQLSASSARAIKGRLFDLLGLEQFTPEGILKITLKGFKEAGLSRPKQEYIQEIAQGVKRGQIDFASIPKLKDEEVISRLVSLRGVGKWTAEMFLIFGLGRPDVLSLGDAGLKRGFKILYGLKELPTEDEMISISEPWRPYRSIASWYLWRAVD